jgi:signal transduction histidine kinase
MAAMLRILLLFLLAFPAWSASPLSLHWQSHLDAAGALTLAQARVLPGAAWAGNDNSLISRGFSKGALWLRAEVKAARDGEHVLELTNPLLDQADLYIVRGERITLLPGGFSKTSSSNYHRQLFRIDALRADEPTQFYLRVAADRALIVWPQLYSASDFCEESAQSRFILGGYINLFLVLCLFSLMAWNASRDRGFIDFIFLMAMSGALQFHLLGVIHEFVFVSASWMNFGNTLFPVLSFVAFVLFARTFLSLRERHPRCDHLLRLGSWIAFGLVPLYFILPNGITVLLANIIGASLGLVALWGGLVAWRHGFGPARFFLIALGLLVLGGMVHVAHSLDLLKPTTWSVYVFPLTAALNVLLLAFALADKVRVLRIEHENAQQARLEAEHQMVQTLRESELLLESRVCERTQQLQEALRQQEQQGAVLHQANQRLSELNEERGAFLGIAAHDLKNPTAAIMGYADLLKARWANWDEDKKLKRIANIHQLAQHISEIIRNLLDINAIESGRYTLHPERLNLAENAYQLIEVYQDRAAAKHIRIHVQAQDLLFVYVDRAALRQILDNLLSNAIKYSPQGCNVHVQIEQVGARAVLRVRDEGPGISAEDQQKLFRKFTRLSARPTGGEHSSGLGLSIVKHIVEASGGAIYCESRLGEGASFVIELSLMA